jgi:hypothetical protein
MPKIALTAAFLFLAQGVLLGQTKIEINAKLLGYNLIQAGQASENTALNPIVVKSGSEGLINYSREYTYPKEYNAKGKITQKTTAYLGIRAPFYVRENDGVITYLARVELCEREDPNNPSSTVLKTTTSFQGQMPFDRPTTVEVGAPGNRRARLEIVMTRR